MKTQYGYINIGSMGRAKVFYRFKHSTNSEKAHQGAKECARRLKQGI